MKFKPKHIKLFENFLKDPLIVKSAKKAPYQKIEDPGDDEEEIEDTEIDDDPDDDPEPDIVDEMIEYFKKRKRCL